MANASEPERDGILEIDDWSSWHSEYENPDSELNARKRAVQKQVTSIARQSPPGPITVLSICGGQGRELIGALEHHDRQSDVRGRIVELDEENSAYARKWAQRAGLDKLEVVTGDASASSSYAGLPPVDLVVISGVFGHIDRADRQRLIAFLPQVCSTGARVVWTYFNWDQARTDEVRTDFKDRNFVEESFEVLEGKFAFTITRNRLSASPLPFDPDTKLFTFGSSRSSVQESES
jgi:hypothetical protein